MKIIKWILIVIAIIVALVLVVAAFMPSERHYSQSVEIEKSPRLIFNQVNSLQNWENWSPFQEEDPNMTSEYFGVEKGVGNRQEWKSKVNGHGSMEIIKSINENEVVFTLDFGMGNIDTTWFVLERSPKSVMVTWGTKVSNLGYPMGRLMMALFSSQMDGMFSKGLSNLKEYLDKQPVDCISGDVEIVDVPARKVISISGRATAEGIEPFLKYTFAALMSVVESYNLKTAGAPVAIYEGDETTIEWGVIAAIPVAKFSNKIPEDIVALDLPQTKAVSILHTGVYSTASDSYYKILDFIMENGHEITGDSWEEYMSDPEATDDPMKLQTRIYFPVK